MGEIRRQAEEIEGSIEMETCRSVAGGGKEIELEAQPQSTSQSPADSSPATGTQVGAPTLSKPGGHPYGVPLAHELRGWLDLHRDKYPTNRQFASDLGITPDSLQAYLASRAFPLRKHCEPLYRATGLDCFGPGRERARGRHKARAHHLAHQTRVPHIELERLRQEENRLEAVSYGPDKLNVCLGCGWAGRNLSRHVNACPVDPRPAPAYKDKWGYNKTNPLMTAELSTKSSEVRKLSQRCLAAQEKNRQKVLEAFADQRQRGHRGPMRLEFVLRKRGRRLPERPDRRKVPDSKILEILALDLPIAQSAERAIFTDDSGKRKHLSQTAFYHRAQKLGYNATDVKARRALITKYIFDLRPWLRVQQQPVTMKQIIQRHVQALRGDAPEAFQRFTPFLSSLEAALNEHPGLIGEVVRRASSTAVITLAADVFQRVRTRREVGAAQKPKDGGDTKRLSTRVIEKGRFCDRVVQEMRQIHRMCADGGRSIAEIQTNHPEFAAWKVRDTLAEEDREVFNHPRQWGPTVGYARLVVGKHYRRHADTVKDWMKAFRRWHRVHPASADSPTP